MTSKPLGFPNIISGVSFISLIIIFAVLIIDYILPGGDLQTFLLFAALTIVFSIYRFDSRIPIIFAIVLLLIAAMLIYQQKDDSANHLAVQSYLLLVVGIVCALVEFYRKTKNNQITKFKLG